jgi:hypothetical protein
MISREVYIQSIELEVKIIKHLYSKVGKADLNYKPSEKQRTLQELLNYIPTTVAVTPFMISGDWKNAGESFKKIGEDAHHDFLGTLDREIGAFLQLVKSFSVEDFSKEVALPTGAKVPLALALIHFNLKFLTAYRMQLFLYLKVSQPELATLNCWFGLDAMPKV